MLAFLLIGIFLLCVVLLRSEGLWGNGINLVNVIFAALIATNYFEPVADLLKSYGRSFDYFCDFAALWGLFAISMAVLRLTTDYVSRVKVNFPGLVDLIGGIALAGLIGCVMVAFTTMTLHTAPLAQSFFSGTFQATPTSSNFPGNPDRQWLAFVRRASEGPLSRSAPTDEPTRYIFDPQGDFILRYGLSRGRLEKAEELLVPGGRSAEGR